MSCTEGKLISSTSEAERGLSDALFTIRLPLYQPFHAPIRAIRNMLITIACSSIQSYRP
jgi:hypothetical protein